MSISKQDFKKKNLQILSFFGLTFIIQHLYKIWSRVDFFPIKDGVGDIHQFLIGNITNFSAKIVSNIFNLEISTANSCELFNNVVELKIYDGCSGFQQIVQFMLFFAIIKGRTINKLWFIPAGALIIHITNIIRMVGLFITLQYLPAYFDFFHVYIFKVIFYGVIFLMWMVWVEKVSERKFKIPNVKGLKKDYKL